MENDSKKHGSPSFFEAVASAIPQLSRGQRLRRWAIRSVIAVGAAYAIVAMNGPGWLVWAAWAYVAVTLALAFVVSKPQ